MKQLICEMCGSNEIVKEDGFFVCQFCRCKYTLEEAKKIIMDVSGTTVRIDNTENIKNSLESARRAYQIQVSILCFNYLP